MASIERTRDHLVGNLQLDPHDYFIAVFGAWQVLTKNHRGRLGASIYGAVTRFNDGSRALLETMEGLCGPSTICD